MNWKFETRSPQLHRVIYTGIKSGWEGWALLMSDEHWDNRHSDLALIRRHHDEAKERNAPIFKFGDTFCAMQGKWDKRADKKHLRPEHHGSDYLDLLVDTAAEFYRPWQDNIALITPGNHEGSIKDRHETDLIKRLWTQLGKKPALGSYTGFVQFCFQKASTNRPDYSRTLYWHHGYGGGGDVTRGLIDNSRTARQATADLYYSGHIHRRNIDENILQSLTAQGRIEDRQQWFMRGSCYKDEHHGGNGWHIMTGKGARPKGGWWLHFKFHNNAITVAPEPA